MQSLVPTLVQNKDELCPCTGAHPPPSLVKFSSPESMMSTFVFTARFLCVRASLRPRPATHKRDTKNGTARDPQLRDHHVALFLVRLVLISHVPHRLRKWIVFVVHLIGILRDFVLAAMDQVPQNVTMQAPRNWVPRVSVGRRKDTTRPCVVSSTFSVFVFGMVDEPCGLATGGVCQSTTREPASAQKVRHRSDRAVRRLGFHCHPHKYVTGVVDGTCTGIDLYRGQCVGPRLDLSCPVSTSPVNLAAILGVSQWFDLLVPHPGVLVSGERFYSTRGRPLKKQRMFQMFLVLASVLPLSLSQ